MSHFMHLHEYLAGTSLPAAMQDHIFSTARSIAREQYALGQTSGVNLSAISLEGKGYRDPLGRTAEDHLRHHLLGAPMTQAWHDGTEV